MHRATIRVALNVAHTKTSEIVLVSIILDLRTGAVRLALVDVATERCDLVCTDVVVVRGYLGVTMFPYM